MAISPSVIAFTVILVIYITVGVFAAIGTAYVSKALLPPKFEQVFYAVYLAVIAGFYLAFAVYFGSEQAWRVEATAVLCFALIALAGRRLRFRSPMVSSAPRMTPAWRDTSSPGALIGMPPGLEPRVAVWPDH
jgi:hypothetical protein